MKWLRGTRKCWVVASETYAPLTEIPDAIGWISGSSFLIECKASRSDFLRDKTKRSRKFSEIGLGNYRFYMAEPNLIKPEELPEGWGLLEVHPRIVRRRVHARRFGGWEIAGRERPILLSLLRQNGVGS